MHIIHGSYTTQTRTGTSPVRTAVGFNPDHPVYARDLVSSNAGRGTELLAHLALGLVKHLSPVGTERHKAPQLLPHPAPIGVPRKRRRPKASSDSGPVRTAPTGSSQYPTHGSRCTGPTGRLEAHLVASRFQLPLLPGHQRLLDRFRLLP